MLKLDNVTVAYHRRTVVEHVSFEVPERTSASLIGRSGVGKSSLFGAILGMVKPTSGSILVDGRDVQRLTSVERRDFLARTVSVVFQSGELIDELRPEENVALPLMLGGARAASALYQAAALLEEVGISPAAALTRDLSGGERQRVAVARALVTRPSLILADEPTGSLDRETRDLVADLILSIPQRWHASVLIVTHDPELGGRTDASFQLLASSTGPAHLVQR